MLPFFRACVVDTLFPRLLEIVVLSGWSGCLPHECRDFCFTLSPADAFGTQQQSAYSIPLAANCACACAWYLVTTHPVCFQDSVV